MARESSLDRLLAEIRSCRVCEAHLPFPPRPILRASRSARVLIIGQAPGMKVQLTGIPWNDPSGDRLRSWMNVTREAFYDEGRIALVPTGFCYPGKGRGGDLPPRPECAPLWHPRLHSELEGVQLTLLVGACAQAYYLGDRGRDSLAETVKAARDYLPRFLPLPHPSPRNLRWFKNHPWFEAEIVPLLRDRLTAAFTNSTRSPHDS